VDIYTRSPIALYYSNLDEALAVPRIHGERSINPARDICPDTGAVFRDSGLRGRAKQLYRQIVAGQVPMVRLIHIGPDDDQSGLFQPYDCVIQATGGAPNVPTLTCDARPIWIGSPSDRIVADAEARIVAEDISTTIPLFLLRVIPTLGEHKDHNPSVHNAYPVIWNGIRRTLAGLG
jgi:hypothetical protein